MSRKKYTFILFMLFLTMKVWSQELTDAKCISVMGVPLEGPDTVFVQAMKDAGLLESMGAEQKTVERIFIINGVLISLIGAVGGLVLGVIAVLLQQKYGFIKLGTEGSFLVDAYPVKIYFQDIVVVLVTVLVVSFVSVRPIGPIARRFIKKSE